MEKFKIGIIGDLHLSMVEKYGKYNTKTGLNTRLEDKLKIVKFCVDTFIKQNVNMIVFLGDIFDTNLPSDKLRSLFFKAIRPLSEKRVYLITGNHDQGSVHHHSFLTVDALDMKNLRIVSKLGTVKWNGINMLLAPYGTEKKLESFNYNYDILFSHIRIKPYFSEGIDEKLLKNKFEYICNGHFHNMNDDMHSGSACICKRDEIGYAQKIRLITLKADTKPQIKDILVPERSFIKKDVKIENLEQEINNLKEEISKDTIVSIRLDGTKEELNSISVNSIRTELKDSFKCVVDKKELSFDDKSKAKQDDSKVVFDIKEDIHSYCKFKNNTTMEEYGLRLYEKALEEI